MEIVNCHGELQVIEDKEQMKAISGSFGLLGVIVSHDFVLNELEFADFRPRVQKTQLSIPPLSPADVPSSAPFKYSDFSTEEYAIAQKAFEEDTFKYYCEWFWFPFQKDCWINCWNTLPRTSEKVQYPDEKTAKIQNI